MNLLKTCLGVLLAAAPLVSAAHASGESKRIYHAPRPLFDALPVKHFAVDAVSGRAWVDVALHERFGEMVDFHRVAVPNLKYDRERSEVVYEADGQRTVCAVQPEGLGKWLSIGRVVPTGDCKLSYHLVMSEVDNGFELTTLPHFEVRMTLLPKGTVTVGSEVARR
jgi:hypothetical protein